MNLMIGDGGGGDGCRRWMASMASMVDADGGGLGSSTQRTLPVLSFVSVAASLA